VIDIIPNWHPVWVHFAIGLPIIGTLFYALAWICRKRPHAGGLLAAARWNITTGIAFALAALVTGFLAAGSIPHDDAGHANMLAHRNWALIAASLFGAAAVLIWVEWRKAAQQAAIPALLILLAGSAALTVTGFEGGQNVFEHGLGVQRLPDIGRHRHARPHEHGAMDETSDNRSHDPAAPHSHVPEAAHQEAAPAPQTPDGHGHKHSSSDGGHSH
jgi:uncharacterized membrane protein